MLSLRLSSIRRLVSSAASLRVAPRVSATVPALCRAQLFSTSPFVRAGFGFSNDGGRSNDYASERRTPRFVHFTNCISRPNIAKVLPSLLRQSSMSATCPLQQLLKMCKLLSESLREFRKSPLVRDQLDLHLHFLIIANRFAT